MILVVTCYGYSTFLPGNFTVGTFFTYYAMVIIAIVNFGVWKIIKRTSFKKPEEADLVWDRPMIERYELSTPDRDIGFWNEMLLLLGIKRTKVEQTDI